MVDGRARLHGQRGAVGVHAQVAVAQLHRLVERRRARVDRPGERCA